MGVVTQEEYDVSKQNQRKLKVKINLLNYSFNIVDELSGVVLDYNFNVSATSDIRRTASITLTPTDSSFDIKSGSKIWLDKYIQIYMGIENIKTNEYVWTNMGIYLINNPNHNYSASNNTMSLQLVDLMARMTGLRNGNLEGATYNLVANSNIRENVIGIISEFGFNKYVVSEIDYNMPYDTSVTAGGTCYQLLQKILEVCPNYQMYFDVDGVFHFDKIPNGDNEQIMANDDIFTPCLIEYTVDTNFEDVKNSIEVFGGTHDVQYSGTENATLSSNVYSVAISNYVQENADNTMIAFTVTSSVNNPYLKINDYVQLPIKNENGTIPTLPINSAIVVQYIAVDGYYKYLGGYQPYAKAEDLNVNSPFYVNGTSGKIRIVLNGDEYDNIFSDDMAQERANYELYLRCKIQDNISLSCVPLYWMDVNWVIEITLPNKQGIEETSKYIIKEISTSGESGTQTLQCMKYYATL